MPRDEMTALAELQDLLAQERDVIRVADFSRLGALVHRKQELISALTGTPATMLAEIRKDAERNQRLLEAALRGIGSARNRLRQIREGARGFTGYDRHGNPQRISRGDGTVEVRA